MVNSKELPAPPNSSGQRAIITGIVEGLGGALVFSAEATRGLLVHPTAFGADLEEVVKRPAVLSPDSTNPALYQVLQNLGDFSDGFWLSLLFYNSFALLDKLQSLVTKYRVPNHYKLGGAIALAATVVSVVEGGFGLSSTADWADIPAGLLGAWAYAGCNLLARRIARNPFSSTT